jgi:hypothetical protein
MQTANRWTVSIAGSIVPLLSVNLFSSMQGAKGTVMIIDEIREKIAEAMSSDSDEIWANILDRTSPGNYGMENLMFSIDLNDISVDIPDNSFTFKNGIFSFLAHLGVTSEEDSMDFNFSKCVSGNGEFLLSQGGKVTVSEFQINEALA